MSRGNLTVVVTCNQCRRDEEFEIATRYAHFWESHLDDMLFDEGWVIDRGMDICPTCCPPEEGI